MYHCIRRLVKLFTRRVLLALILVCGSLAREACSQGLPTPNTVSPPSAAALSTSQTPPQPAGGKFVLTNVMRNALTRTGVYVSPEIEYLVDKDSIAALLKKTHNPAKVIVLAHLAPADGTTADLARAWHSEVGPEQTLLIVVSDNPRELAAIGGGLDDETVDEIAQSTVRTFDSEGYLSGVAQITRIVDVELAMRAARLRAQLAGGIGIALIPLIWGLLSARKKRLKDLAASRRAATDLRDRLAPEMEKMEADCEYALVAEHDEARRQTLRVSRTRTEEAYEEALTQLDNAEDAADYDRAQLALKAAQSQMQWTTVLLEQRRTAPAVTVADPHIEEPEMKQLPSGEPSADQAEIENVNESAEPMDEPIDGNAV